MKSKKIVSGLLYLLLILLLTRNETNADCSKKKIRNYQCDGGSVDDLQKVSNDTEQLSIDYMSINKLTSNLLSRFKNLTILKIRNSQISSIDDNTFLNNKKLKVLFFNYNLLSKLRTKAFQGLDSLLALHLSDNKIDCIEPDFFNKTTPNLKILVLSRNKLGCFNFNALDNQKNLTTIDLMENSDFKCLKALEKYTKKRKVQLSYSEKMNDNQESMGPNSPCPKES